MKMRLRGLITGVGLLSLVACDMELTPQDPREIFSDSKLPPVLDAIANPAPNPEAARESRDTLKPESLQVAVIDVGVDYANPGLANKIAYSWEGDRVVGAGLDLLGGDRFAHPNLIRSHLYALGAELDEEGRIARAFPDPLAKLQEYNDRFMGRFMGELAKHPELQSTFFKRFSKNSATLLGLMAFQADAPRYLGMVPTLEQMGLLLDEESIHKLPRKIFGVEIPAPRPGVSRFIFRDEWVAGPAGLPLVVFGESPSADATPAPVEGMLFSFKGVKAFADTLAVSLKAFEEESHFTRDFLIPYVKHRLREISSREARPASQEEALKTYLPSLLHDVFLLQKGYGPEDPLFQALDLACADWDGSKDAPALAQANREAFYQEIGRFDRFLLGQEAVLNAQRVAIRKQDRRLPAVRAWFDPAVDSALWSDADCRLFEDMAVSGKVSDPVVADYLRRAKSPFLLLPNSGSASHGSHVAGIVLSQAPDSRIFPVRVLVGGRRELERSTKRQMRDAIPAFKAWLSRPVVERAVQSLFETKLDAVGGRAWSAETILAKIDETLPTVWSDYGALFTFVDQITEAARELGRRHVKVANISLGSTYAVPVWRGVRDGDQDMNDLLAFLLFEYFKDQVAQAVSHEASGTLFVVAAGNNGQWMDGKSHSGLPCDLSSPFLERSALTASEREAIAGNHMHNLLCVASVGPEGDLSNFTNLVLAQVPFVAAPGEAVLSLVKNEDCSRFDQDRYARLGSRPEIPLGAMGTSPAAELTALLSSEGKTADADFLNREILRLARLNAFYDTEWRAARERNCILSTEVPRARMDGTSMASPRVAGAVAELAMRRMRAEGLREDAVYSDPRYSPESLIRLLVAHTRPFGGSSVLKDLPVVGAETLAVQGPSDEVP